MTPAEKIYNTVKYILIHKYGFDFLKLSEKDQNLLIADEYKSFIEKQNQ